MGVSWRKHKSSRATGSRWWLPALPVALFLAGWQLLAGVNLINPSLFPPPTEIASELAELYTSGLPTRSLLIGHVTATLSRLLVASVIGILSGTLTGALMGISSRLYRFFDPLITVLMPVPGIAMAPLFIVWLGFGDPTIIALGSIAAFFPLAYNTAAGVRSIDPQLVRAARMMGAGKGTLLFDVYLPWAAGYVLVGVKLGLARCWRTIIAVEFIAAASWGLGYMIWDAAEYLRAGVVYGGIFLLIVIYFVIEKGLVNTLEKFTVERWGMVQR